MESLLCDSSMLYWGRGDFLYTLQGKTASDLLIESFAVIAYFILFPFYSLSCCELLHLRALVVGVVLTVSDLFFSHLSHL